MAPLTREASPGVQARPMLTRKAALAIGGLIVGRPLPAFVPPRQALWQRTCSKSGV